VHGPADDEQRSVSKSREEPSSERNATPPTDSGLQASLPQNLLATGGVVRPDCPPEESWLSVSAGLVNEREAERLLNHAADCDHCSVLLREAAQVTTDDVSGPEVAVINSLDTSSAKAQKVIARRLAHASVDQRTPRGRAVTEQQRRAPLFRFRPWQWIAVPVAALLVIALLFLPRFLHRNTPEVLIARAYSERRVLPTRIEGADHAPVHQARGGAN
jgi:hypothetical protein